MKISAMPERPLQTAPLCANHKPRKVIAEVCSPASTRRILRLQRMMCAAACLLTFNTVHADPLTTLNTLRAEGCAGVRSNGPVLMPSAELDAVARELSVDKQLNGAIQRTGYPAANSVAVYVRGSAEDTAIRQVIENGYCEAVSNPKLNEVGLYRSGDEIWIVLAERLHLPAVADASSVAARVLELVNGARATARLCGDRQFEAAPPLTLSSVLTGVAALHAQDMASHEVMDHRGSDGSQPAERVRRAGYVPRATGENVAAGQPDADTVVASWLDSPGHCSNIMAPQFTEMGIAFAVVTGNPPIYWAQVLAAPR